MKLPELLAPAGDWEKMTTAFLFGADAVYMGGKEFGLRAGSGNFTVDEIAKAVEYAHERGKKVYITVNAFPNEEEFDQLGEYLQALEKTNVDAAIVADPGVFRLARRVAPNLPLHISTQANIINREGVNLWKDLGAERVILARETTLEQIEKICSTSEVEIEAFMHGAMCWAYSGRCLLSAGISGRSANQGACTQVCRWRFHLMEEKRVGQYFPIEQDERGTYIMNSKDMAMIDHIPELVQSGLASLKIEGRMKTIHYLATVVKAYREALDAYAKDPDSFKVLPHWIEELDKFSHRPYGTGFYFGSPQNDNPQVSEEAKYIQTREFVGVALNWNPKDKRAEIEQRNVLEYGDELEILPPQGDIFRLKAIVEDEEGNQIARLPHPKQHFWLQSAIEIPAGSLIRKVIA